LFPKIALGLVLAGAAMQTIPYGRQHSNPAVIQEPPWDTPRTRALAKRACFNCHSNETVWPWYSNIAPISWLTQRDVSHGRAWLNFSEWDDTMSEPDDVVEQVAAGDMPPWFYLPMHPEARLTQEERTELVLGLEKSLNQPGP
jgi:hypothetical protein